MAQWETTCLPMQEMQEMQDQSLGREHPLEEEMATHSSILAWRIPWAEGPGRLQSTGSQGVDTTEQLSTQKNKRNLHIKRQHHVFEN